MHLNQHPDKTIQSTTYSEFLRVLYSKQGTMRAYPTRLLASMVYTKPWIENYHKVDWDGASSLSRIKSWRTLARRLKLDNTNQTIVKLMMADLTTSFYNQQEIHNMKTALNHQILYTTTIQDRSER